MSDTIKPVAWMCPVDEGDGPDISCNWEYASLFKGKAEPLYTAAALDAAREQGRREGWKDQARISIPTETMEQEFSNYHRLGHAKGFREGRLAGLEEAAKVCGDHVDPHPERHFDEGYNQAVRDCADAIRALKEKRDE